MFFIIGWLIYGIIVGTLAKMLHPGEEPGGFWATVGIGVAGSYIGGFVNWFLGWGGEPLSTSGLFMGVLGGVIFCSVWSAYNKKQAD